MRVFVIVNAEGGTVRTGAVEADGLAAMLAEAGLDAQVVFATGTAIQSHAEQALVAQLAPERLQLRLELRKVARGIWAGQEATAGQKEHWEHEISHSVKLTRLWRPTV